MKKRYHTVLSIAGSDSIGGAGIQADIKTCTALGTYAMTAITAVTAQNTSGVSCFEAVTPRILAAQLQSIAGDVRPDAVKIGMIPDKTLVGIVASAIADYGWSNVVVDPVMVATSGDSLSSAGAPAAMIESLLPLADMLTPNLPEAELITGMHIDSVAAMLEASHIIVEKFGVRSVLLKGGHLTGCDTLTDIFLDREGRISYLSHPAVATINTHGTGCSLSSAIASRLAFGDDLMQAAETGVDWLSGAINAGSDYEFGHGHGPINHMFNIINRS